MKVVLSTHLRYPGYMPLQYDHFFNFLVSNKKAAIKLRNLHKGISILDTDNSLVKAEDSVKFKSNIENLSKGYIIEVLSVKDSNNPLHKLKVYYEMDKNKEIFVHESYFTDFLIHLEIDDFREEVFKDDTKRKRYNAKIFEAFNFFVRSYNRTTKTGNVRHIEANDNHATSFILYQSFESLTTSNTFENFIKKGGLFKMEPTSVNMSIVGETGFVTDRTDFIAASTTGLTENLGKEDSIEYEFLSHALEQMVLNRNYKYAFLEAFLAIESSIDNFLDKKKLNANISKQYLEDFKREVGIGYKMNIELPLAIGFLDEKFKNLLIEINKIRKLRNEIVHRGTSITHIQARSAIDNIYMFVDHLKSLK